MNNPTGDPHTLCNSPRCSLGEGHTLPCNEKAVPPAETPVFKANDRIVHEYCGAGTIVEIWVVAQAPDEETEYRVRIPGYNYLFTLGESRMILAK